MTTVIPVGISPRSASSIPSALPCGGMFRVSLPYFTLIGNFDLDCSVTVLISPFLYVSTFQWKTPCQGIILDGWCGRPELKYHPPQYLAASLLELVVEILVFRLCQRQVPHIRLSLL